MKKRVLAFILTILMVFSIAPTAFAGEDITLPVADRARFLTTSVQKPGTVSLSVDVTEESGISSAIIVLKAYNGDEERYIYGLFDYQDAPKFSGTIVFDIPVPLTAFSSTYYLEQITLEDAAGNSRSYFNSDLRDGYANDGSNNYIPYMYDDNVKCIIEETGTVTVVASGDEDITLPVADRVRFLNTSVEKPGTVSLSVDITEESGIASAMIVLKTYNGDEERYIYGLFDYQDAPKFSGTIVFDIPVSLTDFSSTYYLEQITLEDAAGNSRSYFNSDLRDGYANDGTNNYIPYMNDDNVKCIIEGAGTVTVIASGDEDITLPVADRARFLTTSVQKPGTVSLSVDVTEESGIASAMFVLKTYNGQEERYIYGLFDYQDAPKLSGTIVFDIPVPLTAFSSTYYLEQITLEDAAGNSRSYFNPDLRDGYANDGTNNYIPYMNDDNVKCIIESPSTVNVVYDYDVAIAAYDTDSDLMQQISDMEAGKAAMVFVDFSTHDTCTKAMLDAIKGQDKTIVFYYEGIQWAFSGLDITGETKDIHMSVSKEQVSGSEYSLSGNVLKLEFYANGELPGPVRVRLQSDCLSQLYGVNGQLYLYCLEDGTPVHEASSVDYFVNGYDSWCKFDVDHNSTFLISTYSLLAYNANGADSGGVPSGPAYGTGDTVTVLGNTGGLTKTGYVFNGWNTAANGSGISYDEGDTFEMPAGGITLYAQWKVATFIVTFDSLGGTAVAPKTAKLNTLITAPTAPTKSGCTFKGWYREPGCVNAWNFSVNRVTDNITLYAKWAPRTYTITFDSRGGSAVHYASVAYNTLITKPAEPTRYGYDFVDWYKESACVNAWSFDTDHMPAKNITLYAKWIPNKRSVTFDAKGGEFKADNGDSLGSTLVRDAYYYSLLYAPRIPVREHYTFKGWYKNETYTSPWYFSTSRMPDRDLTLYVKWQPETFKVTFNSLGGSRVYSKTAGWDTLITKPANPTRTGYTFDGWYKEAGYLNVWDFNADKVYTATTLYAKWTPKTYTVTYDSRGGSPVGPDTGVSYGTLCERPDTPPTKEGFIFGGWYTSRYLTTQWNFATNKVTKNITLYAKWMTNQYKITFNANGGTGAPAPMPVECYSMPIEPGRPTREGYFFDGWYKSRTYFTEANRFYFGGSIVTGSMTLYAKWTANQYKVTFNAMGGTPTPAVQTVGLNQLAVKPAEPTKAGYFFGGWYTSSTSFTSANEWVFETREVTKNVTLYARWRNKLNAPTVTVEDKAEDRIVITLSTDPYATWYGVNKYNSAGQYLMQYESVNNEFTLTEDDLTPGETYFFYGYVRHQEGSMNYGGCSKAIPENPGKPGSVTAKVASYNTIHVEWSDSGIYRNTGYEVWRATSLKGTYTKVGTTASTVLSFDNKNVTTGKTYYYKVRAFRQTGTAKAAYGAFSDIKYAKASLATPTFPTPKVEVLNTTTLKINWNAVAGASGYELWRATADTGVFKLLKSITNKTGVTSYYYKNTGLVTNQPYYYKVRAYRIVGDRKVYSSFTYPSVIATPMAF